MIFLIILLQPIYLKWLGYDSTAVSDKLVPSTSEIIISPNLAIDEKIDNPIIKNEIPESFITIVTPLYTATISNRSGGSLNHYVLTQLSGENYKYKGGYDEYGVFNGDIPVSLVLSTENYCQPCLAVYDDREDRYDFFNAPFQLVDSFGIPDTIFLYPGESTALKYVLYDIDDNILIQKSISFSADNFISHHDFTVNEDHFDYINNLEFLWTGGLRPSEKRVDEDVQYSSGIISQAGEIEDLQVKGPDKNIDRTIYNGQTDWAAIRTKYFITALLTKTPGSFATLSAENMPFGDRIHTPLYHASVGFPLDMLDKTGKYPEKKVK